MKLTGRKFKCIALDEYYCYHWADSFVIGEIYSEVETVETSGLLLALEAYGVPWSVDAECFDLI